jgi:6-phosphofructokinase 1
VRAIRSILIVHSGGPTAVLNASLTGILDACRAGGVTRIAAARFGVAGLIARDWIDLSGLTAAQTAAIRTAPGSVIGSSRRKLEPAEAEEVICDLQAAGVDALFYTGGNGSMKTALLLEETAARLDSGLAVIGVPKTIDNDVAVTDHTPGYGSAARFFALALRDVGADNRALPPPVSVIEVIGRNTGWVVGATALARARPDDPPHLIYCPERPPTLEQICADVADVHRRLGCVVVAVCEGLRDPSGEPFGADVDRPGSRQHELAANLAHSLARLITAGTGLRARSEKPGLLGRSSALAVSETDAAESHLCGWEAVQAALAGHSGVMVGMRRVSSTPYAVEPLLVPLREVAGIERPVPADWIATSGNDVTEAFLDFVRPLIGPIPAHPRLP